MLLRHGHAGPLSVLLSIFDRGGDHTSAWSKGWPVPPPLLLPSPLLTWLYSSRTVSADDPRWETRALTLPSPEELKCRFDFFAVRPRLVSPPVLPVLSESRPLLDASFHEIIDNGQSTAARGGAEESGDRCPHLQPCHKTSLPNYSIKTRV